MIIAACILALLLILHLKKRRCSISKFEKRILQEDNSSKTAVLDITVDIQCYLSVDGEIIDLINPGESKKITLRINQSYILMFMSNSNIPYHKFKHVDLMGDECLDVNFLNEIDEKDLIFIKEEKCFRNLNRNIDITPKIYDEGGPFLDGLAKVKKGDYWGQINKLGEEVVACEYLDKEMRFKKFLHPTYEHIGVFCDGLATVKREGRWGYIDKSGNEITHCCYDYCEDFSNGYARVKLDIDEARSWALINREGRMVISFCEEIEHFKEGISKVKFKGKYHFLNIDGKPIGHDREGYENAICFCEGFAAVKKNGKWGFIDKYGKTVIDFTYDSVGNFSDGMAYFTKGETIGFIDGSGKELIPRHVNYWGKYECYKEFEDFHEGLAAARSDLGWGYIDKEGKVVIECQFDEAGDFINGVATVRKYVSDLYAGIDTSCKIIKHYEEPSDEDTRIASFYLGIREGYRKAVNEDSKYGFLDQSENVKIPFQYNYVSDFNDGLAIISKGLWEWGFIDKSGNETMLSSWFNDLEYVSERLIKYQSPYGLWGLIMREK